MSNFFKNFFKKFVGGEVEESHGSHKTVEVGAEPTTDTNNKSLPFKMEYTLEERIAFSQNDFKPVITELNAISLAKFDKNREQVTLILRTLEKIIRKNSTDSEYIFANIDKAITLIKNLP